jgi:hypothetical protein
MKKIILVTTFTISAIAASAQLHGIRLNGYAAYVFDNSFDTYYTSNTYLEGTINGGFQWGVGLEFLPSENYGIELVYYRQDTKAPIRYDYGIGVADREVDLGINYIMAGGVRYMNTANDKLQPYGGLLLGAAIFSNKNPQGDEEDGYTKFAWGARLGVNIWVSEKVGLKLQTQLLSAVQGFGGGLSLGTGGAGAGVSTYSTLLQFGLGGGLCFKIDQQ